MWNRPGGRADLGIGLTILGRILVAVGDTPDVQAVFDEAADLLDGRRYGLAHLHLGRAELALAVDDPRPAHHQLDEAADIVDALGLRPTRIKLWLLRSRVHHRLRDMAAATAALDQAQAMAEAMGHGADPLTIADRRAGQS